jgi:anti-sigma factor RsiW
MLNALADGGLSPDQLALCNQHLDSCASCTSKTDNVSALKSATAKAGQRYTPSADFQERIARFASGANSSSDAKRDTAVNRSPLRSSSHFAWLGWAAATVLLIGSATVLLMQRSAQRAEAASAEQAALVGEVFDLHVAALTGNLPLQVVSTDRHTVKPWFQGKIPFSFNLPQTLPADTTLDGADLIYLKNQPAAQLIFSIGRHHASVILRQRSGAAAASEFTADRAGFHVIEFATNDLEGVGISDVDSARLAELMSAVKHAQTGD